MTRFSTDMEVFTKDGRGPLLLSVQSLHHQPHKVLLELDGVKVEVNWRTLIAATEAASKAEK